MTSEKPANAADSAASIRIGTYKLSTGCLSLLLSFVARGRSGRGRQPGQRVDHAVGRITAPWLGQVRQELEREAHQRRAGHPVPGRELHHPRVPDGPDELAPEGVVATVGVPQ